MLHSFLFITGLASLAFGGHLLVHFTVYLAKRWGLKPVFLSIVVLGMGTSAPEWFVTVVSSFKDLSDVALGNVIGSNIANILLILGLTGVFYTHKEEGQIKRFSLPFLLASFVLLFLLSLDGMISRTNSLLLLAVFALYLFLLTRKSRQSKAESTSEKNLKLWQQMGGIILGFLFLFAGSELTINSGVFLGRAAGLSERFIGLFVVSVGTSLPELATTLSSVLKKQDEMVLGNIIGSNLFNTLFVLGSAGLLHPIESSQQFLPDYFFMFFVSFLLLVLLFIFRLLSRTAAFLFLTAYILYICFTGGFIAF